MGVVTKTGDDGDTGLFGGPRTGKDDPRLHAYGTVDELNSLLGVILAAHAVPDPLAAHLRRTQHLLFRAGADLATPMGAPSEASTHRIRAEDVAEVEGWIGVLEKALPPQNVFLLPGGSHVGSVLHVARTVCRRAERWIVALGRTQQVNPELRKYVNRLSDWLFLAAREANRAEGCGDTEVRYE